MGDMLSGKTAVATGAASGNGRAISLLFAEEGADIIIIADIQQEPREGGDPTHERIEAETNASATFIECDVTDYEAMKSAVTAADEFGGIDVMVNNAGIFSAEEFLEEDDDIFDTIMNVNVRGTYYGSRAAANAMIEKEPMLEAVNDILATLAMSVLDRGGSRTICVDFMNNPYHGGPENDEDELRRMPARDGTTQCHCYCTAFVIARGKPLTLAIEPVDGDDSKADAVERVLARVETYPFETEHILIDRAAYVGELIGVLRETAPPVFPVKTGKESPREKLSASASYMTEETICEGKEHEQTFPLAVNVTYQNGDRGKSGVKTTGYAAYGLEDRTPRQVASMYDKRSQIEKSYEKFREARAMTAAPSPVIRLFYVGVGFLLEQLWLVVQWAVLAQPQRGGRALPVGFTFDDSFLHGIERELDDELGWKDRYRTNGVGLPAGCEHGLG